MSLKFNDNIRVVAPKPVDDKYTVFENGVSRPYLNVAEVLSLIPPEERYKGLTVLITDNSEIVEYWFLDTINLVVKVEKVDPEIKPGDLSWGLSLTTDKKLRLGQDFLGLADHIPYNGNNSIIIGDYDINDPSSMKGLQISPEPVNDNKTPISYLEQYSNPAPHPDTLQRQDVPSLGTIKLLVEDSIKPDEEDLTYYTSGVYQGLKFKNRASSTSYVGLGYNILRRDKFVTGSKYQTEVKVEGLPTTLGNIDININGVIRTILITPGTPQVLRIRVTAPVTTDGTISFTVTNTKKTTYIPVSSLNHNTITKLAAHIATFSFETYTASIDPNENDVVLLTSNFIGKRDTGISFEAGVTGANTARGYGDIGTWADSLATITEKIYQVDFVNHYKIIEGTTVIFKSKIISTSYSSSVDLKDTEADIKSISSIYISGNYLSLESSQFFANTIHEIRYDYDLNGMSIILPIGAVLLFNGGSIKDGNLVGNNTIIKADLVKIFNTGISVSGSFSIKEIYPEWFGASSLYYDSTSEYNTPVATNPPSQVDTIPNSSDAFNSAFDLAYYSKSVVKAQGKIYRWTESVNMDRKGSHLQLEEETIIHLYMNGTGDRLLTQDKDTYKFSEEIVPNSVVLNSDINTTNMVIPKHDQFYHTSSLSKGLIIGTVRTKISGNGTISSAKSTLTINILVNNRGYHKLDMSYGSPDIEVRTVGADGERYIPASYDKFVLSDIVIATEPAPINPNQEIFNKVNGKRWRWTGTTWALRTTNNAVYTFNTALRFDVGYGYPAGGRIINPQIKLWDMFGWRGIEIYGYEGGWFNESKIEGTVSNKNGNFVSIFTDYDVMRHDWSKLIMQFDALVGGDCRALQAYKAKSIKFGTVWDVRWIQPPRVTTLFQLGKGTEDITLPKIDALRYVDNQGINNILENYTPMLNQPNGIVSSTFKNVLKYRSPGSIPIMGGGAERYLEINTINSLTEFETALSIAPNLPIPRVFFDEDDTSFKRVIDIDNSLLGSAFDIIRGDAGSRSPIIKSRNYSWLVLEFGLDSFGVPTNQSNPLDPKSNYPLKVSITKAGHWGVQTLTYDLKPDVMTGNNWGNNWTKNRMIIPLALNIKQDPKLFIYAENTDISGITVDLYSVKLYTDSEGQVLWDNHYGATNNSSWQVLGRPNAAPKGFIYENTTLGITEINRGTSEIPNWTELPKDLNGVWEITLTSVLTAATANYSKIGKQIALAGQLSFATATTDVTITLPYAPNYGGVYIIGDLTFTLTNNSTTAKVQSAVVGTNKPFQLNYRIA